MATFKDAKDREWTLALDAPLVKRVKEITKVDLGDLRADPIMQMSMNPVLLVDVLYCLCEKQAKALDPPITDIDFGESLVGQPISDAADALEVAITDFSPPSRRSLLQSLRKQGRQMQEKAMTKAMEELGGNQERIGQAIASKAVRDLEKYLESTDTPFEEMDKSAT